MYARLQSVVVIKRHVVHTLATNMPAEMYSRLFQLSQWSSGIEPCAIIEVVAGTNPLPTVAFRIHGGDSENVSRQTSSPDLPSDGYKSLIF